MKTLIGALLVGGVVLASVAFAEVNYYCPEVVAVTLPDYNCTTSSPSQIKPYSGVQPWVDLIDHGAATASEPVVCFKGTYYLFFLGAKIDAESDLSCLYVGGDGSGIVPWTVTVGPSVHYDPSGGSWVAGVCAGTSSSASCSMTLAS